MYGWVIMIMRRQNNYCHWSRVEHLSGDCARYNRCHQCHCPVLPSTWSTAHGHHRSSMVTMMVTGYGQHTTDHAHAGQHNHHHNTMSPAHQDHGLSPVRMLHAGLRFYVYPVPFFKHPFLPSLVSLFVLTGACLQINHVLNFQGRQMGRKGYCLGG